MISWMAQAARAALCLPNHSWASPTLPFRVDWLQSQITLYSNSSSSFLRTKLAQREDFPCSKPIFWGFTLSWSKASK